MRILTLIISVLTFAPSFGQVPNPQTQKYKRILFQNGTAHIGNEEVILNSIIGIEEGKIRFVKNALTNEVDKKGWDTIISIKGKHVYPGFIAANIKMGLTEIDAVRATNDFREVGYFNPNIRSLTSFNTDSKVMYTVRTNGVLVAQSTPRGGYISGTSSIMALDGWNWQDAVYKADDGVHLNWPKKYTKIGWWMTPSNTKVNKKYNLVKTTIYAFFEKALSYSKIKNQKEVFLKMEAMRGVFSGKQRLFIHVDYAPEINDVIDFSRHFNLKYPVIVGGFDAHLIAERLIENHFSVMLGRPHSLPEFDEDFTYVHYQSAYKLQQAGVPYCIQSEGDMEVMNARNLPFLAGTAWAYGLTEEQAIAAISLNVAKILGIDDRIGSLESGKDATLFISDGNALDMRTNNVTLAMVKGNFIVLDNHQMQLSRKYHTRYGLE